MCISVVALMAFFNLEYSVIYLLCIDTLSELGYDQVWLCPTVHTVQYSKCTGFFITKRRVQKTNVTDSVQFFANEISCAKYI
jgi:hypothetical protein